MLSLNRQCLAVAALLLTGAVSVTNSYAQNIVWSDHYGGEFNESGFAGVRTADGGFAVLGSTYSYGAGDHDFYLVRTDSLGDTVWTNTYGGAAADYGYDLLQTTDGGFVMVGVTHSAGAGGQDLLLVKTNSEGLQTWSETYGGLGDEIGWAICPVTGGFIITGSTTSFGAGVTDVWLIRTNSFGDTVWTRTFGGVSGETGFSVRQTSDGGCIVAGATGSFGEGYSSIYAIRTDGNGDTLWTTTFGGAKSDMAYCVEEALDGGFVFAGATSSYGSGYKDVYVVKTDPDGVVEWDEVYGGAQEDIGYSVRPASDGGYLIGGTSESFGRKVEMYVIKTNPMGGVEWDTTYGGANSDYCRSVVTDQGAWFLIGHSFSFSSGGSDLYLVKVLGEGATPVGEDPEWLLPSRFTLEQNYPNPFNAGTTIPFSLDTRATVDLHIYNILGQCVYANALGELPVGEHRLPWDARTDHGDDLASGVYFYRLTVYADHAAPAIQSRKMLLLK